MQTILLETIKKSIARVYNTDDISHIYQKVLEITKISLQNKPDKLIKLDLETDPLWYNNQVYYMFYVDSFALNNNKGNFRNIIDNIDYLKNLGITTIYLLPFVTSPQKDGGFDIVDPTLIHNDLGTMQDFRDFVEVLHVNDMKVMIDLVLNHLSDESNWFEKALAGDKNKIEHFVYKKALPKMHKYIDKKLGYTVDYKEANGLISSRRVIFPEFTDNHYREETILGEKYYFYHTFYPFQIDINWKNPEVLYANLKNIAFWCNEGVDIFRLDAIPYLIKKDGTNGAHSRQTHAIIKIISAFIKILSLRTVLQAEASGKAREIIPYFGKEQTYNYQNIKISRTSKVQIAYDFTTMPALWSTLISGQNKYFWHAYAKLPTLPKSALWNTFLRVHDELSLEMVSPEIRDIVYDNLRLKGDKFREGWGVSGRLANFLNNNPYHIAQAFALLLSIPGCPVIYYGDEIGAQNNFEYAKEKEQKRIKNTNFKLNSYFDSRDINRGPLLLKDIEYAMQNPNTMQGYIYKSLKNDIAVRRKHIALSRGKLYPLTVDTEKVLVYLRKKHQQRFVIVHNLVDDMTIATINLPDNLVISDTLKDLRTDEKINYTSIGFKITISLNGFQTLWIKL